MKVKYLVKMLVLALWCLGVPAVAQRQKVSSYLRVQPHGRQLCAFVKIEGADADSLLAAHRCRLLARQGNICIAMIPQGSLQPLAARPEVLRIEASRGSRLTMDTTRTVVNAMPVYEGRALPQAYTGRGVVMGLMDVGFDLTHPTFLTDDERECRIRRFWDMVSPDTVGSRLPVGREYTTAADIAAKACSTDNPTQSHGTHTLGIAAGSGYRSPYRGMAPGADICLVNNAVSSDAVYIAPDDLDKYTTATDALGFKYIFDYADSLGRPCVISFSEGFQQSFVDDDRLFEEFVDGLLGPGHIIVTSSGNESGNPTYINKVAGQAAAGAYINSWDDTFDFFTRSRQPHQLVFRFYDPATRQLLGHLTVDTRQLRPAPQPELPDSAAYRDTTVVGNRSFRLEVWKYASAYQPLDTVCYVALHTDGPFLSGCDVAVVLEGQDADVELWSHSGAPFGNHDQWTDARICGNVLQPGAMRRIICVGNTEHRTGIVNYLGEYVPFQSAQFAGGISRYSSVGPTAAGLMKPDVCAPGMNVISSYSSYYLEHSPDAYDIRNGVQHFSYNGRTYAWNANSGTSMSAPVVGGAVALWLEANPTLSPDDVLDVLAHTCRQPDATLIYPNNTYGHGEIDVYRGLLRVLRLDGIQGLSASHPAAVTIRPQGRRALVLSTCRPERTRSGNAEAMLAVYDAAGRQVCRRQVSLSQEQTVVPLPVLPPGVYVVQLSGQTPGTTGSELVRL